METTRIAIFAASLFAIAYGSGMYSICLSVDNKTKKPALYAASGISLFILALSMAAGLVATYFAAPALAQVGCFLLLSVSAVRKILEIKNTAREKIVSSFKDMVFFSSSDAVVAGFGAGLGGINAVVVIVICIILHMCFINVVANENEQSCTPLPALGVVLFISLAVLL